MKNNLRDACTPCSVSLPGSFDFHVHTCLSDGAAEQTPEEVCRQAAEAGLTHMAITDHDWMLEREERIALSAAWGLDLIAGCEFSAGTFINGKPHIIHIGGHWLDEDDPKLWEVLRCNQQQDFEGYVKEMLSRCLRHGLDPSHEGVDRSYGMLLARNPNAHHLGKQAVTNLLFEPGCVASRQEARDKYLSAHGERLAYVPGEAFFHFAPLEAVMHAVNSSSLSTNCSLSLTRSDSSLSYASIRGMTHSKSPRSSSSFQYSTMGTPPK